VYSQDAFHTPPDHTQLGAFINSHPLIRKLRDRLVMEHITPLLLTLLIVTAMTVSSTLLGGMQRVFRKAFYFVTCLKDKDALGCINSIDVTYSRAMERGLIKGLATYNILQNPKYKVGGWVEGGYTYTYHLIWG